MIRIMSLALSRWRGGLVGVMDSAGVGQGEAVGPAMYEVVVGGLAGEVAGAADHGVDGGDGETFDMDPLF